MFRPAEYIATKNLEIPDDISVITGPMSEKYPSAMAEQIMSHGVLKYEELRIGQRGACLNQNLLGNCNNSKCTYIHGVAKPTAQRTKEVATKLGPAVQSFMTAQAAKSAAGGGRNRNRNTGTAASN